VRCVPSAHPVGGPVVAEHLWHAEGVATAEGMTCAVASTRHNARRFPSEAASEAAASVPSVVSTAARRSRRSGTYGNMTTAEVAALLPPVCLQLLQTPDGPCGHDPSNTNPQPYSRAQLPPPPIAVDWLGIAPGATGVGDSTVTTVILWPYCWGSVTPVVTPVSANAQQDSPLLWVDKLSNPCGTQSPAESYTICFEPAPGQGGDNMTGGEECFTVKADDPTVTCATVNEEVCLAPPSGNLSDFAAYTSTSYVSTHALSLERQLWLTRSLDFILHNYGWNIQ
jgi:hypothetical protein